MDQSSPKHIFLLFCFPLSFSPFLRLQQKAQLAQKYYRFSISCFFIWPKDREIIANIKKVTAEVMEVTQKIKAKVSMVTAKVRELIQKIMAKIGMVTAGSGLLHKRSKVRMVTANVWKLIWKTEAKVRKVTLVSQI